MVLRLRQHNIGYTADGCWWTRSQHSLHDNGRAWSALYNSTCNVLHLPWSIVFQ